MKCTAILVIKNDCWIWITVDRLGKRFINFVIGDRSTKTAKKFWETIKHIEMKTIASDYWKPYEAIITKDKHIQSKAETFTVEGYTSLFRHFLARMRRKSKCYSKSMDRLKEAIMMIMLKRNNQLSILY